MRRRQLTVRHSSRKIGSLAEQQDKEREERRHRFNVEALIRKELEESGVLADEYRKRLDGKVLNAASLHVADEARVMARPEALKVRRIDLIASHFETLIATDVAAAEAWIDTYRDDMDPEWVADALDQVLAATM